MSCIGLYNGVQYPSNIAEQKPENIEFEFFCKGEFIGREIRSDTIIGAHGSIEKAIRHLLSFYPNIEGGIDVKVSYKNEKYGLHLADVDMNKRTDEKKSSHLDNEA